MNQLFDFMIYMGKVNDEALNRAERHLNDSLTILWDVGTRQRPIGYMDEDFPFPHLDPEDDPNWVEPQTEPLPAFDERPF